MSTPTLREAAQRFPLTIEQIDTVLRSNGWLRDDMPRARQEKVRESFRRTLEEAAALTQAADAGAAEPVAWMRGDGLRAIPAAEKAAFEQDGMKTIVSDYDKPLYAAPPAQQLQQAVAREREKWTTIADRLLAHCGEGECPTCSEIICPHGDTMHFHHDGCPTCEQEAAAIRQQGTP